MIATILSIIAGVVSIVLLVLKANSDKAKVQKEKQDALDKKIDNASSFNDFVRIDDELHNK